MRGRCVAVALTLLCGAAAAQQTTQGLSEPVYTESLTEVYRVETAHGVIYGEVVRPVVPDGVKVPVIFTYSPYNILGAPANQAGSIAEDGTATYFVPRGYARAVFDVVGTRESSGCYHYGGIAERETGAAVVDFLGAQDWSNGRVGMIGGSYDGATQWAAAVQQPKHLVTVIPQVAVDRWYDYAYGGGIRYFLNSENATDEGFDTPAGFDFGFGFIPPLDAAGPQYADALATRINPCQRILHMQRGYESDPIYDAFWQERDYRRLAGSIRASALIEGGWLDHNVKHWDSTRMFLALPEDHPKRMVIGQWRHSASQFDDAQDIRHAWFDHWLLDLPTGVMDLPAVDSEANDGERRQSAAWPPPGTEELVLPLASLQLTDGNDDHSWLDTNPLLTEEQVFEDGCRTACLQYASAPLASAIRISGSPQLRVSGVSDAESTHLTPVLFAEKPDGSKAIVTRGFLNLRNRNGLERSEPLAAGESWSATVEFWDTDYVIAAGDRVGLLLMSSNAVWALPDSTRAGTALDPTVSALVLPLSEGAAALGGTEEAKSAPARFGGATGFDVLLTLAMAWVLDRGRRLVLNLTRDVFY